MNRKEAYRRQLMHLVRGMLTGDGRDIVPALENCAKPELVKLFIEGNQEKRLAKLRAHLKFMAQGFEDIENLLKTYVERQPLMPYATVLLDANCFLDWLVRSGKPTPEQCDFVAYQRAQHQIARNAGRQRLEYARFEDRLKHSDELHAEHLLHDGDMCIYLNPMHVWARFHTNVLLDDQTAPPVDVLCYPANGELRTTVLEPFGIQLIRELSTYNPCTIAQWSILSRSAERDDLVEFCQSLARLKLVAFERT